MAKDAVKRLARLRLPGFPAKGSKRIISEKARPRLSRALVQAIKDRVEKSPRFTTVPEDPAAVKRGEKQEKARARQRANSR
jgi:hypothetical protein